jgi:cephalosporin hydroxylase
VRELVGQARVVAREQGLGAAALKGVRYPLKPLFVRGAIKALRERREQVRSKEELFDVVRNFNYRGVAITSWQKKDEILSLLGLVEALEPVTVVEIGTASGGTLFMLTEVAAVNATIISVDLPGGRLGGETSDMRFDYPAWRTRLYRGFAREDQTVHALRADSHDVATVREVRRLLGERTIDFLFIDGDHSYDGVRQDFELYSPLVRKDGVVAFHDIVPGGPGKRGDPGDVPVFWKEVGTRYRVEAEFVEDWDWGSCGIGVLRL